MSLDVVYVDDKTLTPTGSAKLRVEMTRELLRRRNRPQWSKQA